VPEKEEEEVVVVPVEIDVLERHCLLVVDGNLAHQLIAPHSQLVVPVCMSGV
jgi:hypothetical protein